MTLPILHAAILTVLMAFPSHRTDRTESKQDRRARLDRVAYHIAHVASVKDYPGGPLATAAILIAIGKEETWWASYVGKGKCNSPPVFGNGKRAGDCDGGKAHTYFQVWEVGCKKLKGLRLGSDRELAVATDCAARIFWAGYRACGTLVGGFSRYATGRICRWSGATARMETMRQVDVDLRIAVQLLLSHGAKQ